ncbi:hypothetical protein BAE44_0001892, partial [Dichanthelium oligosanthes]
LRSTPSPTVPPSACAAPAAAAPPRPSCAGTLRRARSSSLVHAPRRPGPGARSPMPPSTRPTAPSPSTPATLRRSSSWPSPSTFRATVFPRCVPSTPPSPRCLPARSSCVSEGTRSPSVPRSRSRCTAATGSIRPPQISVPAGMASPTVMDLSLATTSVATLLSHMTCCSSSP